MSPGARQQVEQHLRSALKTFREEEIKYIPCINQQYPKPFRRHAASLLCTTGFPPCEQHPTQDVSVDIPDGILDDAPLAVILGGVAWFAACLSSSHKDSDDEHNGSWHCTFRWILQDRFETFTYPLPKLPTQGFAFCTELSFDCPGQFGDKEPKRILKIFAAVAVFLTNKHVLLPKCCPKCQVLYTRLSLDATLSTNINELSVNTDVSGMYPADLDPQNSIDIGLI